MSIEALPSLDRMYYEMRLYGQDVYNDFAQYCFWRTVVATHNPDWIDCVPAYFLSALSAMRH